MVYCLSQWGQKTMGKWKGNPSLQRDDRFKDKFKDRRQVQGREVSTSTSLWILVPPKLLLTPEAFEVPST